MWKAEWAARRRAALLYYQNILFWCVCYVILLVIGPERHCDHHLYYSILTIYDYWTFEFHDRWPCGCDAAVSTSVLFSEASGVRQPFFASTLSIYIRYVYNFHFKTVREWVSIHFALSLPLSLALGRPCDLFIDDLYISNSFKPENSSLFCFSRPFESDLSASPASAGERWSGRVRGRQKVRWEGFSRHFQLSTIQLPLSSRRRH